MPPTLADARLALSRNFGYPDFRGGQAAAVEAVLSGRDVLVLMPTGGGKSLCFQVPALVLPGLTLVVSPLISLMKDQVDTLLRKGVPAGLLNSTLSQAESNATLDAAERGELRLLYVAPERFASDTFRARLRTLTIDLLAIDEAHCISQWGHDFRPSYRRIGAIRELLRCNVIALTATATPAVRDDIMRQLRLRDPVLVVTGFDRTNLAWHVYGADRPGVRDALLLRLLRRPRNGVAIVYASTRQRVDGVADLLNRRGVAAIAYHAGIRGPERQRLQEAFLEERARVVVATSAFGMGIDKPNVRLVVHYGMPADLESYYQEAGRGGRDGKPADCVLLHAYRDRFTHEFLIGQTHPPRDVIERVHASLVELHGQGSLTGHGATTLARRLSSISNEAQVASAIRILYEAGILERGETQPAHGWVRLVATPFRIRDELPERSVERALLRALFARFRDSLGDGVRLERRELSRLPGAPHAAELLASLGVRGFVAWRPPSSDPPLRFHAEAGAELALDWAALDRRRRASLQRLHAMERYAYVRACRRAFVLRYYGERPPPRCDGCDRCLPRAARLLPDAPPPRPAWLSRLG